MTTLRNLCLLLTLLSFVAGCVTQEGATRVRNGEGEQVYANELDRIVEATANAASSIGLNVEQTIEVNESTYRINAVQYTSSNRFSSGSDKGVQTAALEILINRVEENQTRVYIRARNQAGSTGLGMTGSDTSSSDYVRRIFSQLDKQFQTVAEAGAEGEAG